MKKPNRVLVFATCVASSALAQAQHAAPLSANLREISNLASMRKLFDFKKAHLDALRKNSFFTSPSDDRALYWAYGTNDYRDVPSLVTADNVLQIYHVFFESTLRGVESKSLYPEVQRLTTAMLKQATATYQTLKGTSLEKPALRNIAYFGVADRLLGLNDPIDAAAQAMVAAELGRIKESEGFRRSTVVPYDVDYSQFIVRGHYTKTPPLGRYFQGMMWYGLLPFAANARSNNVSSATLAPVQQALLISHDLSASGAETSWRKIYDVTGLYAGAANDLTPMQWRDAASKVFGAKPSPKAFGDTKRVQAFVNDLAKMPQPAIVAKRNDGVVADAVQFRFMGQRAIPDSVILQRLCDPDKRPFPSPLDTFAVLGNRTAKALLDGSPGTYNPKKWPGYLPERAKLESEFARLPKAQWSANLYWSWFDALRLATAPAHPKAPAFMKTDAWAKKSLYSALASWTELRHDTILYGLQTVAEMGGDEPALIKGYVEPNIALYKRMEGLIDQTERGLRMRGYLSKSIADQFNEFGRIVEFMRTVSEKELAGKKLSREEYMRIRLIEGELESTHNEIQRLTSGYLQLSNDDLDIALVADVHTAYNQALTVGVGRADNVFAVVPIEGKLTLTRGSAFSYYEFLQPISSRLTDTTWKRQLDSKKIPPRPAWVSAFHIGVPVKIRAN